MAALAASERGVRSFMRILYRKAPVVRRTALAMLRCGSRLADPIGMADQSCPATK